MDQTPQHNPYPLDEVQQFFFKRSQSQQDILGRTNNFSGTGAGGLPAELERLGQARSTENVAEMRGEQRQQEAEASSVTSGSTGRMPFPPVPKVEQLPSLPSAPTTVSSYPTTGSQFIQAMAFPGSGPFQYPVYPPAGGGAGGGGGGGGEDQGWRVPQYRKRGDHGPGPPPPQSYPGLYFPQSHQQHPPSSGQSGLQMMRYLTAMDDCGSGLSRESSREDINSECEQQFDYEQRFRVDRKKLEVMMTNSPEFGEAAAEFFERIGIETETTVIWPSRLKIGAKSKKDPHIRVGGRTEEGVTRAKMMITEVLDTSTNSRVTMKMDVSYTDHSHIIGKGGNTIRRVMAETNCHIHFPDSNRSNPNEKSNQVSIAGEMTGVERARARVRELTPLLFNFDLPIMPSFQTAPDTNNPFMRAIQDQYNVQIMFRQKQKNFHATTVVVKGCEWECARVKEATLLLMDHLFKGAHMHCPVFMTMEVSPQHHATVLGKGNINLKIIMQKTNTTIIFPDAGDPNIPPIKKGSVTISSNSIHNVYLARQLLVGSLPIVMMFDIPETLQVDDSVISKVQDDNEVIISIKPKARQSSKSCIIKTQERNSAGLYSARHLLLQLDRQGEPMIRADIPETYKVPLCGPSSNAMMANLPGSKGPFVNLPLPPHLQPTPLSPSFVPLTPLYTPTLARPSSPWTLPPPPPSTPVSMPVSCSAPPANHPFLQDYAMLVLNNYNRLQHHQQQQEEHLIPNFSSGQSISPSGSQCNQNSGMNGSSGMGSSLHSSPLKLRSPRNSSPVNAGGNLTNNLHKLDLTSSSSGIGGVSQNSDKEMSQDLSIILSGMTVEDRRAPGCEKKVVQIATDYEQKKLLATRAMQSKPMGEPRTPNSVWSGLGFSSSMPEAVIREKMAAEHARAKQQRENEVASNSDWLCQSNTFDSMLAPPGDPGQYMDELSTMLSNQGLGKYADVFLRHEIDLPTFAMLTDEELKEIGIQIFGARKKLLLLARETKKKFGLS